MITRMPILRSISLAMLLSNLCFSQNNDSKFAIRISAGVAHLPMSAWKNFASDFGGFSTVYSQKNPNFNGTLSI
jgi:hypothetical protein